MSEGHLIEPQTPLPAFACMRTRLLFGEVAWSSMGWVTIKLGGPGERSGDDLCVDCVNLRKLTQLIYKHKAHQTYYPNFEV